MDLIAEIQRLHLVSKESISSIARDLNLAVPRFASFAALSANRFTAARSNRRRC
jgi:hypothetical protein